MDQIDRLVFDVTGRDRGGSKVLDDAARKADAAHQSMSKLGSTLSGLGGPFGLVIDSAQNLGAAFEGNAGKAQKLGLAMAAAGAGLVAIASKDAQAQRQLQQAIQNTGDSASDYGDQIEETIKRQENNAHAAHDTQEALTTLVTATQDTTRAVSEMNLVADIAAAKHESLAEAATQLVQAQAGNTRAFKAFGIVLDTTLPKQQAVDKALKQLQDRLSGQASASVDTFTGHLKIMETKVHDAVAAFGEKWGPEITAVGAALTAASAAVQIYAARQLAATAAVIRETEANAALAASYDAVAASAATAGAAQGAAALGGAGTAIGAGMAGRIPGALGIVGRLAVPAAIAYGTYQTAKYTLAKDSRGLTGEQESGLKRLEGQDPSKLRGEAARFLGVEKQLKEYDAAKRADKEASEAAAKANDKYTTSLIKQDNAASRAALSLGSQIKALQDSTSKAAGLSSAEDDLQTAMHNLAQSVHDGSSALHGHTLAAEANRSALRDAVAKMLALTQAQKDAGVSGLKVRESAIEMSRALETNAVKLLGNKQAVDKFLQGLGVLPPQIAAALGATELLSEQVGQQVMDYFAKGIAETTPAATTAAKVAAAQTIKGLRLGDEVGAGQTQSYIPKDTKTKSAADAYAKWLAGLVVGSYAPAVSDGVDKATNDALNKAKSRLLSAESEIRSAYQGIRDQIVQGFNVASLPSHTDALGFTGGPEDPRRAARSFVHQLEEWANLLGRLRRQGLNETMLEQFEQAGVAAIPAMREVLRSHEVPALNKAERHIRRIGRQTGADFTSDQYGEEIARLMQHLPRHLAHEFEKMLRQLNIITDTNKQDRKQGHKVAAA